MAKKVKVSDKVHVADDDDTTLQDAEDDGVAALKKMQDEAAHVKSSDEVASADMKAARNRARELEIEETLAEYTAKPKVSDDGPKKGPPKPCCWDIRRFFNCCITVPLHEAVVDGEAGMTMKSMQKLNKKAATRPLVNQYDDWGRTALALAVREEREDLADLILSLEANPDKPDKPDTNPKLAARPTPLHSAVQAGLVNTVLKLRWREAEMNPPDENGTTPLMLACMLGNTRVVQALLDSGANSEMTDMHGWTPLIYAAYGGHLAVTELILDQGVDKNEKDKKGLTAYDWAMYLRKKTNRARDKTERERNAQKKSVDVAERTHGHPEIMKELNQKLSELEATFSELERLGFNYGEVEAYLETFQPKLDFKTRKYGAS